MDLHPEFLQVLRQIFGHALGEGSDQDSFASFDPLPDLTDQIVHLPQGGTHFHFGVDKSRSDG